MEPELIRTEHSVTIPQQAYRLRAGADKPLLLLLHGFSDSASSMLRRFGAAIPETYEVLAPNGPFPQPIRAEGQWKEAWAWYFADLAAKKIHIHPDVAAGAVKNLVAELGLADRPKILCGFSQGGWFLPYLAKELAHVQRALMVGSGFRPDDFAAFNLRLPVSAVHGDQDDVIPCERSREEFFGLGAHNQGGHFHVVRGMTHSIDDAGRAKVRELLEGAF